MKSKEEAISQAASLMGKKGGKRTFELHGSEHYSQASLNRKTFGGGWPKGRPRKKTTDNTQDGGK